MPMPLQPFGAVLRTVFRFARLASYTLIGAMAVFLALRLAEGFRFCHDIHPALGWLFLAAVLGALGWFIGRPVARFLRVPAALQASAAPGGPRAHAAPPRPAPRVRRALRARRDPQPGVGG